MMVPEAVINLFEVVEVDEQDPERQWLAMGTSQHLSDPVHNEGPVGEPGQPVVQRLVAKLLCALVHQGQGTLARARQQAHDQEQQDSDAQDQEPNDECLAQRARRQATDDGDGPLPVRAGSVSDRINAPAGPGPRRGQR